MHRLKLWLAIAGACITSLPCHAGLLKQATMGAQVQQFLTNGEVSGCGLNITAVEKGTSPRDVLWGLNGSFVFASLDYGLVKGRAFTVNAADILSGRAGPSSLKPQKTEMVWIKSSGATATTLIPGQTVRASDDPGYIMYLTPLDPLLAVISAIFDKAPVQVGFKSTTPDFDVVLFGAIEMAEADRQALSSCMNELTNYLKKGLLDMDPSSGKSK